METLWENGVEYEAVPITVLITPHELERLKAIAGAPHGDMETPEEVASMFLRTAMFHAREPNLITEAFVIAHQSRMAKPQ